MAKKKSNRGGIREGAGRPFKPDSKVTRSYALAPDVAAFIDAQDSKSLAFEKAIRGTKAFKDWAATQKPASP